MIDYEPILYRSLQKADLYEGLCELFSMHEANDPTTLAIYEQTFSNLLGKLIADIAERYGLSGNLAHVYLTYALINSENAFSLALERRPEGQPVDAHLERLARQDLQHFMHLYACDFTSSIEDEVKKDIFRDYTCMTGGRVRYPLETVNDVNVLARQLGHAAFEGDLDAFCGYLERFYRNIGVGKLGLYKAFRMSEKVVSGGNTTVVLEQMTHCSKFTFNDLVGYQDQVRMLCDNTESFLAGRSCNNVLLFGDSGTGKSSSIKACMNKYFQSGLRMIEVYKHQFQHLPDIIKSLKGRNYRFVIYMDDLSFEEFEIEYKYLKAVIEGGLEEKPENVCIYATSNRRHLIKESVLDNEEKRADDLHGGDGIQEKLSLSARFGVTIYYGSPNRADFEEMVEVLARRAGITLPKEELFALARRWELRHGMMSGRLAAQFIADLSQQKL
ncbi:MAG: ATP-binding protein [Lachnospiraceae bacterium]|nr:ATP-binding protein [Lachnospiraceae bacterium]